MPQPSTATDRAAHAAILQSIFDLLRAHRSIHDLELTLRRRSSRVCGGRADLEIVDVGGTRCVLAIVRDDPEPRAAEVERNDQAHQQKAVADLGLLALGDGSLADLMDTAVALVAQTLSVDLCKILELLPDGKSMLVRAGVGWADGVVGRATIPCDDAHAGFTLRSNEPIVVEVLQLEERFHGAQLLHDHHVVSGVSLIIHGQERPYGILSAHTTRRHAFSADDVKFLQGIANVLGLAIERKRRERYLEALATVTRTLRVASSQPEMLAIILENVQNLLDADGAALILRDHASGSMIVECALGSWASSVGERVRPEIGVEQRVVMRGGPSAHRDALPAELPLADRAAACIPLIAKDEFVGSMWVCCEKNICEDELGLLTSIGNMAANAINRVRLHERTVDLVHQLHSQESFIARIVESTPSSLLVFDRALRAVLVNRNFLEKSHREKHATQGHRVDEIFPSVLLEYTRLDQKIREVFRTGQAIDGDKLAYRTPGRSTHIYYYRLVPLKIEDRVENVLLFMDDITERERLGQEIRRIERHLAGVVESANDLVLSLNVDGSIMTWNRAAERVSGRHANTVRDQKLLSLCPPGEQPAMAEMLDALRGGAATQQVEISLLTTNGQAVPIAWSCSPMLNDDGGVTGIVAIGRDLTEQRQLEAQLIQSTKMASLGVMAGGIAHELRNPLGIISASAQLLQRYSDDAKLRGECARKINDATKRSSLIIDNLLRFARPMTVRMQLLDVNAVIEDTCVLIAHQAALQQVRLLKRLAADLPSVYGNPALLQQVFTNLILNACDAISDGGSLVIATRAPDERLVEILFEDTGCGIAPETLPKIFDPFFTTRPIGKGTGLGLSISYSIIQQHHGKITARSAVGQGATFTVSLPAASDQ